MLDVLRLRGYLSDFQCGGLEFKQLPVCMGLLVKKLAMGQVFLQVLWFSQ